MSVQEVKAVSHLRVITQYVQGCKGCPHRRYYSSGVYECHGEAPKHKAIPPNIDQRTQQPEWCPLRKAYE